MSAQHPHNFIMDARAPKCPRSLAACGLWNLLICVYLKCFHCVCWVKWRERDRQRDRPGRDITSLLHEGTEGEPQTVSQREVGRDLRSVAGVVADLPLGRTEPTDDEHHQTDAEVRQYDAQPDVVVQRVHEREHARLLLLGLLDHDANAELHERLAEVDHSLTKRRDRQRRHCYVRLLHAANIRIYDKFDLIESNE